ncbi:MAG: hypothetical protein Q4C60_09905 [Eubacteriales bacterium]|nr:hypothetical protein [Eubacteriales bacterium]
METRKTVKRKRSLVIVIACVCLLGIAAAVSLSGAGRKPYKNLEAAQIASAQVLLSPPGRTVEIRDGEIGELVSYLKELEIYQEDQSYTEYSGQSVVFTLTMTDGAQTEIMEYSPFLVIDGVGYRAKQEPCEALSEYANELLEHLAQ